MKLSFAIDDPELLPYLAHIQDRIEDAARAAVDEVAARTIDDFSSSHRYTNRTGELTGTADMVQSRAARRSGAEAVATIVWPARHAQYVDAMPRFDFTPRAEAIADRLLAPTLELLLSSI